MTQDRAASTAPTADAAAASRHAASRCAARACTARACSRCSRIAKGETHHRVQGRGHHAGTRRCAATRTTRTTRTTRSTSTSTTSTSSTPSVGGNAARWINHACSPTARPTRTTAASSSRRCATIEPGEELFYDYGLIIDERYTPKLKKQYDCRCGAAQLPRHDARAQAMTLTPHAHVRADAALPPLRWDAEALWQQLEPLLPGPQRRGAWRAPTRPTRVLLERARARAGAARRPASRAMRRAGAPQPPRARAVRPPRRPTCSPACWWPSTRPRGRGRQGRAWQSSAGRVADLLAALPLEPRRLVGPVAGGRRGAGRGAGAAAPGARAAHRPEVAQRPVAGRRRAGDRGRKLGGMLIETVAVGARRMVVVGVGLNCCRWPPREPPSSAAASPACRSSTPRASAPAALAPRGARRWCARCSGSSARASPPFAAAYARARPAARPARSRPRWPTLPEGVADGVAADGALRVRRRDGALHEVASGEVSVRPA